jgi:superfamily II helicase
MNNEIHGSRIDLVNICYICKHLIGIDLYPGEEIKSNTKFICNNCINERYEREREKEKQEEDEFFRKLLEMDEEIQKENKQGK